MSSAGGIWLRSGRRSRGLSAEAPRRAGSEYVFFSGSPNRHGALRTHLAAATPYLLYSSSAAGIVTFRPLRRIPHHWFRSLQNRVVERRLQLSRNAVDEIAVRTLVRHQNRALVWTNKNL